MTQDRTAVPITEKSGDPTLGQGFNKMTGRLLQSIRTPTQAIETSDYSGDQVYFKEIETEELMTHRKSLEVSLGVNASFVLSVLGEFSQNKSKDAEQITAFLVIMMPLRTERMTVPSLDVFREDAKETGDIFSAQGDSYVSSITYGNYLVASLTASKDQTTEDHSFSAAVAATLPKGVGVKGTGKAEEEKKRSLSKKIASLKGSGHLIATDGKGGYDLDKTKANFIADAGKYKDAEEKEKGKYSRKLWFETARYDTLRDLASPHALYVSQLESCHAELASALYYTGNYLDASVFFDQALVQWPFAKGAQQEGIRLEKKAFDETQARLKKTQATLLGYQAELEMKSASLKKERLTQISKALRDEMVSLMEQKEHVKKTAARRLVGVVTLKPTDDKQAFSKDLMDKLKKLSGEHISHVYIELEGKEAKELTVNVYDKPSHFKENKRCFALIGDQTFLELRYLTVSETLRFGVQGQDKRKWGQSQAIHIKIYAVHPHYGKTADLDISIQETDYFSKTLKPTLADPFLSIHFEQNNTQEESLARSENQWRAALRARQLTNLPQKLTHFVEREELKALKAGFEGQEKHSVQVIIHGMGGVGKTQLATEYAHAMQTQHEFVRWVHADPATLKDQWEDFGKGLGLELKGLDEASQRRLVCDALSEQPCWLLVLDNLQNEGALKGLLPEKLHSKQHVLITSRSEHWGQHVKVVPLSLFTQEQAEIYFKDRLTGPRVRLLKGSDELAKELGYLPLALSHAVAYMQQHDVDGEGYLKRYQEKGIELFGSDFRGRDLATDSTEVGYKETVLTTWLLSMEQLEKKNERAAQLVKLCGYLHPDGIPEVLFKKALELKSETDFDGCIGAIKDYSLLSREAEGIKMHRLVQSAIRYHEEKELSKEQQFARHLQPLAKVLSDTYPDFYHKSNDEWQLAKRLEPHIRTVSAALGPLMTAAELKSQERQSVAALQSNLLLALGNIAIIAANFKESKHCCEQALALRKQAYGEDAFETASALVSMGDAEWELGQYKKAEGHYLASFAIREKMGDQESVHIALIYRKLGDIFYCLGDAKRAREFYEKGLAIYLMLEGEECPSVATMYNNLGIAYGTLGEPQKALELYEKGLGIRLKVYGEAHPNVATSYSQLGSVYQTLGDAKKSLEYHEKALGIRLKVYGDAHPDVATSYSQLGSAYQTLGDARKSLEYHEKALGIRLKAYGDAHPDVATSYSQLGSAYQTLGDAKKSLEYHEKALGIRLKVYGDAHPDVATSYRQLGSAYQTLGDARKSLEYHEKALGIRLKVYGEAHPNVAISYSQLGSVYQTLGDARKSLEYHEKALGIRLKAYGDAHPDVADSYTQLGSVYQTLGDAKKSLEYHEKALGIRLKVYGDAHPDVATSYSQLGSAYQTLGDARKSLEYHEKALGIRLKAYGDAHPDVATSYRQLGSAYQTLGDARKSLEYHEKALGIRLKVYGDAHPDVATSYRQLGSAYQTLGDARKSLEYHEKALGIRLKVYGDAHPDVATSYSQLGSAYQTLGDAKKSLEYHEKALGIRLKVYGDAHPDVATSYSDLGDIYNRTLGDAKKALEYHEKALAIRLKAYGDVHPDVASSYLNLGTSYTLLGDTKKALAFFEKNLGISLKIKGEEHPDIAASYGNLGVLHFMLGNTKEALIYQEKSFAIHLKAYGEIHPHVATNYNNLGAVYEKMGEMTKAIAYYEKSIAVYLRVYDENHPDIARSHNNLGKVYQTLGNTKKTIEHYKKSLAIYQKLNREECISEIRSSLENLEKRQVAFERKFQPVVPVLLPRPLSPRPPVPVPVPKPQPGSPELYLQLLNQFKREHKNAYSKGCLWGVFNTTDIGQYNELSGKEILVHAKNPTFLGYKNRTRLILEGMGVLDEKGGLKKPAFNKGRTVRMGNEGAGIGTVDFSLSAEQQERPVALDRKAVEEWVSERPAETLVTAVSPPLSPIVPSVSSTPVGTKAEKRKGSKKKKRDKPDFDQAAMVVSHQPRDSSPAREEKDSKSLIGSHLGITFTFEEMQIATDGDCGFSALQITRDELVTALRTRSSSRESRQALAPEIEEFLRTWSEEAMNDLSNDLDEIGRETDFRKLSEAKEALSAGGSFVVSKELFEAYLSVYRIEKIDSKLYLGYCAALLYARYRFKNPVNLYIWRAPSAGSRVLTCIDHYPKEGDVEGNRTIHMVHTANYTHYNVLKIRGKAASSGMQPTSAPYHSSSATMTSAMLSAPSPVRSSTAPTSLSGEQPIEAKTVATSSSLASHSSHSFTATIGSSTNSSSDSTTAAPSTDSSRRFSTGPGGSSTS